MSSPTLTEVVLPGIVEPDGLVLRERPIPAPGPRQALLEMLATGVSFAERGMRRGRYPNQPRFPFVLGYDLVGTVTAVGEGVDPGWVGHRVAVATKTGGWSTHLVVDAAALVPVPEEVGAAEAETVVVNGITAWQMLHRTARVRRGQSVLVHGATGGVGTILVQLARLAGARVLGTASPRHHDALRALGVEPLDYDDPELAARVRALAPEGLDAVFDHVGPTSVDRSFALLRRGGTLVAYGTAASLDGDDSALSLFARMLGRMAWWSLLPNGRRASFYDFWGGKLLTPARFRTNQNADLAAVLDLLARGEIRAHVAATFPLHDAAAAMALAESRTTRGKVILTP